MTDQRYPADLLVTAQNFAASGWKEILETTSCGGYSSMWQAFSAKARSEMAQGRTELGKVLWLLADACSMMLMPKSFNEPFKPFMVMEGRRSVIPDDLSDSDIAFYADIVDAIDDAWLQARVADLVWLKQSRPNIKLALTAIDAYRQIPLDKERRSSVLGTCC